jgi:hypothetical protein
VLRGQQGNDGRVDWTAKRKRCYYLDSTTFGMSKGCHWFDRLDEWDA